MWRPRFLSRLLPAVGFLLPAMLFLQPCPAAAQSGVAEQGLSPVPAGLTLPVGLQHTLRAGSTAPGTPVVAYTMQRVPVAANTYLPRGTEVLGTVVDSQPADPRTGGPARLVLRFTELRRHGHTVPLRAATLAIASINQVNDTYQPVNFIADRSTPGPADWSTQQVGGDVVARAGWVGEVDNARLQKVGFADFHGIYAIPAQPGGLPRALGVFSAEARGLYGFSGADRLADNGGQTIVSSPGKLELLRGDGLLLQVLPPA